MDLPPLKCVPNNAIPTSILIQTLAAVGADVPSSYSRDKVIIIWNNFVASRRAA